MWYITCFLPKITDAEAKINSGLNLNLNKLTEAMFTLHILDSFCADTKTYLSTVCTATAWGGTSHSHLYQTSCWCGWPRGFGALISCPHSWIFTFIPVCSSPCPLLIYFCNGPNRCLHCTKVWHKTDLIGDARLSRLMRHVQLHNPYRNCTKIPLLWRVNRSLILYDFHGVNIA